MNKLLIILTAAIAIIAFDASARLAHGSTSATSVYRMPNETLTLLERQFSMELVIRKSKYPSVVIRNLGCKNYSNYYLLCSFSMSGERTVYSNLLFRRPLPCRIRVGAIFFVNGRVVDKTLEWFSWSQSAGVLRGC